MRSSSRYQEQQFLSAIKYYGNFNNFQGT